MKKIVLLLSCLFVLFACEQIDENNRLIKNPNPIESNRVVLLEEFTGVGCVNCPDAALIAMSLHQLYPENVVLVSLHGDIISRYTDPIGGTDFRLDVVKDYFNFYGPFSSLPQGMLNRSNYAKQNSIILGRNVWASALGELLKETPKVEILTAAKKNNGSIDITVHVETKMALKNAVNLVVEITEDGIVGSQMMPDGTLNRAYVHNHILRKVLTPTWGDEISISKVGDTVEKQYSYAVPEGVDVDKCTVVAYVAERTGNRSILQASALEMTKAIPPTSINFNRSEMTISEGNSKMLFAKLMPEGAFGKVIWESGDETIATVEGGNITAIKAGVTTITARTGDLSAECQLTVIPPVSTSGWDLYYLDADGVEQKWEKEVELTLHEVDGSSGNDQIKFDGHLVNNEDGTSNYHIEVVRDYAFDPNPSKMGVVSDEVCTFTCVLSNGEKTQVFDFEPNLRKGSEATYYAHFNPVESGDYVVNYYFYRDEAKDQKRLITVTYHYEK